MTQRKKLIEVALPLEAINAASVRENYIYRANPSALHKWWSGKPLATARAMIFASLVDDPDNNNCPQDFVDACMQLPKGRNAYTQDTPRQRLFDFIEQLVQWDNANNKAILQTAHRLIQIATNGNPPSFLDPFAGSGSIPLEAQRLGLKSHASDLNPVSVLINKSMIDIPPNFAQVPPVNPDAKRLIAGDEGWEAAAGIRADVLYYGNQLREEAWKRVKHLYPTLDGRNVIAWLWARTVKSPNPSVDMWVPLVSSFQISTKKGREIWAEPQVDLVTKKVKFVVHKGKIKNKGTVSRSGAICIASNTPIPFDYIRSEGKAKRMGFQMMAIVTNETSGRTYYSPTSTHETIAQIPLPESIPATDLPEQALGFRVQNYGLTKHADLFTARQLVALNAFCDSLNIIRDQIFQDALDVGLKDDDIPLSESGNGARAYAEAVSLYLAFAINKYAAYGCSLALWYPKEDRPKAIFASQTLPMAWNFVEINPFSEIGGSFQRSVEIIADAIPCVSEHRGLVVQAEASNLALNDKFIISTDPPYYDSVGYADLSDFFYIWLRRNLHQVFPKILATLLTPKEKELIAAPSKFAGNRVLANTYFENGVKTVFYNLRVHCSIKYPISVYYAFKQSENSSKLDINNNSLRASTGWETMLEGLTQSGFIISATWPIRTERGGRMRDIGSNALASSIILICRPRPEDAPVTSRRDLVAALQQELPAALREMQSGNIAPVDLAQASIGPGMAVYSRYSKVLEADGSPLTVRTALQLINQELDAYLSEQEGDIDADSRFGVSWFSEFGFDEGEFGRADVLARAKNVSVEGLQQAGVVEAGRGKVRLIHWSEYDPGNTSDWNPQEDDRATVWEATHHLIERLDTRGETGAATLLLKMNADMAAEARNLAYRLYSICERKSWAEHARYYNALVISWPGIQDAATELKQQRDAGEATEQPTLFE